MIWQGVGGSVVDQICERPLGADTPLPKVESGCSVVETVSEVELWRPDVASRAAGDEAYREEYSGGIGTVSLALQCAEITLDELGEKDRLLEGTKDEMVRDYRELLESRRDEDPIPDILVFLARRKTGRDCEEAMLLEIDNLVSVLLGSGRRRKVVRCPFLHLTRMPSIYREIPSLLQFCRQLMIPVVQAHEKDLITLAVINPVTGARAMDAVSQMIEDASGRRPIPAMVIAHAAHWRQLNRKHFGS